MQFNSQWRRASILALALFLVGPLTSLAQTFRGSINGSVTDPTGAVVSNATVTATDTAT